MSLSLQQLQNLTDEQLDATVTVCDSEDEYFASTGLYFANEAFNDVLDHGHPYLVMNQIALY